MLTILVTAQILLNRTAFKPICTKPSCNQGLTSLFDFVLRSVGDEWLAELTQVTANSFGYKAIVAALDAHIKFCEDAPKHVEAFYRLWFDSMAPDSQLKGVILGIRQRRCDDVVS